MAHYGANSGYLRNKLCFDGNDYFFCQTSETGKNSRFRQNIAYFRNKLCFDGNDYFFLSNK